MRIAITGGAGFIGANLVRYINKADAAHEVVVFDDFSTGRWENLDGCHAKVVEGSVADPVRTKEVLAGADAIVHLGALGSVPRSVADPVTSHLANLTGTLNVLEAARATQSHVIFASSSSVYGSNPKLPKSEFDWTRPMSPYAVTKLGAEGYVLAYQLSYGLPTLAFRFFNVYGPLQAADHVYAAVIPRFLDAALKGKPLPVHGDGHQSRDFTFVGTVCEAIYTAVMERRSLPDPVNLAFGTSTTLLSLIELLEQLLDRPLEIDFAESRVGDVRASKASSGRLREYFPNLQPVPLRTGLERTTGWFTSLESYR